MLTIILSMNFKLVIMESPDLYSLVVEDGIESLPFCFVENKFPFEWYFRILVFYLQFCFFIMISYCSMQMYCTNLIPSSTGHRWEKWRVRHPVSVIVVLVLLIAPVICDLLSLDYYRGMLKVAKPKLQASFKSSRLPFSTKKHSVVTILITTIYCLFSCLSKNYRHRIHLNKCNLLCTK